MVNKYDQREFMDDQDIGVMRAYISFDDTACQDDEAWLDASIEFNHYGEYVRVSFDTFGNADRLVQVRDKLDRFQLFVDDFCRALRTEIDNYETL